MLAWKALQWTKHQQVLSQVLIIPEKVTALITIIEHLIAITYSVQHSLMVLSLNQYAKKFWYIILVTCLEVGFVNLANYSFWWEIGSFKVQIPRFLFKWSSSYMLDLTILIKCIDHYIYFYFHMHIRRDRCCGD